MMQYDEYDAKSTGKVKVEAFEEGKDADKVGLQQTGAHGLQ